MTRQSMKTLGLYSLLHSPNPYKIYKLANSTVSTNCTTCGTNVTFYINIGVGDPLNWGVYIYGKKDRGLGVGGTDPNYPYYVEEFHGSNTATVSRTELADGYVAVLALQGIGEVDFTNFSVVGTTTPPPTTQPPTTQPPTTQPPTTQPPSGTPVCQAQNVTGNAACQAKGMTCVSSNCGGGCTDYPSSPGNCGCTAICSGTPSTSPPPGTTPPPPGTTRPPTTQPPGGTTPPPAAGCPGCDLTTNLCVAGSCFPKSYVIYGVAAIFVMMMLKR